MNQLFFELIQVAIGVRMCLSRTPSADEWGEMYEMAKIQSLVGVCFAGVQKILTNAPFHSTSSGQVPGESLETSETSGTSWNLPEVDYLRWMGMAAKIQQCNEVANRQCASLQKQLAADGLRTVVLKGQGVGQLYAEHLRGLRQSGDIDVWIDADAETAIKYVRSIVPTDDIRRKHISLKVLPDTEVEVHWIPSELDNPFRNRLLRNWYKDQRECCFTNRNKLSNTGEEIFTPPVEFNLVYLLLHIYEHFLYEGIGLRQMMDWYFVLNSRNNDNTWTGSAQAFNENHLSLLKQFGLMRFTKAVMWVMQEVFGMQKNQLLCEPDEGLGKQLLDEIMEGGNFGKYGKDGHQKDESKAEWAARRMGRTMRLFRYDPIGAMCRPFIRLRLAIWYKKMNNNKQRNIC